jgi:selenocysteine-specific translation elongation factor
LPPVKSAHIIVTGVGVVVTAIAFEGAVQVESYWLLPGGLQVPNVAE